MDFTLSTFICLLNALNDKFYRFSSFIEYVGQHNASDALQNEQLLIILRHDVDLLPKNALMMAQLESRLNIKGTYYFRSVTQSYDEKAICQIAEQGHEIGYHYEDVDLVIRNKTLKIKNPGEAEALIDLAYESFCRNLEKMRKVADVRTICMHGSPCSRFDNRLLWQKYNYRQLGLVGEPYFDIDFNKMLYLTDTGRRWDGDKVNVRDKVVGKQMPDVESGNIKFKDSKLRSTAEIIHAAKAGKLPDRIMMTFHPQRWTNNPVLWTRELIWQNLKNVGKRIVIRNRGR
jgi:hypothetical protein